MTMREKMARAAYRKMAEHVSVTRPGAPFLEWDDLPEEQRRILLATQYAALEALREPSGAMLRAGAHACDEYLTDADGTERFVWSAMIDAVLAEKAAP